MPLLGKPYLQCEKCGRIYSLEEPVWKCECGGIVDVKGTGMFPKQELKKRPSNFWRYREALALSNNNKCISLGEVMTPVLNIVFRGWGISVKLESVLPTGSYKDRGIALCKSCGKSGNQKNCGRFLRERGSINCGLCCSRRDSG